MLSPSRWKYQEKPVEQDKVFESPWGHCEVLYAHVMLTFHLPAFVEHLLCGQSYHYASRKFRLNKTLFPYFSLQSR